MKKQIRLFFGVILGLLLIAGGLWALKAGAAVPLPMPYLGIGVGCGLFGHHLGALLNLRVRERDPEAARRQDIAEKDERNIRLRERAQAKAYNIMVYVFGALLVSFGLMGVEMAPLLLLVAAYLFVCGSSVYYHVKYEKEM